MEKIITNVNVYIYRHVAYKINLVRTTITENTLFVCKKEEELKEGTTFHHNWINEKGDKISADILPLKLDEKVGDYEIYKGIMNLKSESGDEAK